MPYHARVFFTLVSGNFLDASKLSPVIRFRLLKYGQFSISALLQLSCAPVSIIPMDHELLKEKEKSLFITNLA